MAVIRIEYQIGGAPGACVSVIVNAIVIGGVTLACDNFSVRLGEGLLVVTDTTPVKAALFARTS